MDGILRERKQMPDVSQPINIAKAKQGKKKDKMEIELPTDHMQLVDFRSLLPVKGRDGKIGKTVKREKVVDYIKQQAEIINELDDL